MKLVETDIETPPSVDHAPAVVPPPAEHRRVAVSFLLTSAVLVATVVSIYVAFPERHNELVSSAMSVHETPGELDLSQPSQEALAAWSIPVVGKGVPWPAPAAGLEVLGARRIRVLRRDAAVVRYRVGKGEVTLVVQRARDTPPRRHKRQRSGVVALSWRKGKWTFVAVGGADAADVWRGAVGAP